MAKNVQMEVRGSLLVITVDLSQDHGPSKSGNSNIIATSAGNMNVARIAPDWKGVKVGLNVFKVEA